jgi:FixJ family two-component response regulator
MPDTFTVFVVDDDVSVRESLELLVSTAGWQPEPFASAREFLACPRPTIEHSRAALRQESEIQLLRRRYASLTPREREVMALVVAGLLNKVGGEPGISEITVKAHRGQMMRKMKADSLPALVTMASRLGLQTPPMG